MSQSVRRLAALIIIPVLACGGQPGSEQPAPPASQLLRPGDVVRLAIYMEPEMSDEYPVGEDGTVVLPKIGEYQIASKAPDVARKEIREALGRYLRNPSIDITFLRRINVLGAVREPGLVLVDPTMTVADALAMAGGMTPQGRVNEVQLIRGDRIVTRNITSGLKVADTPIQSGDQLFVPERSWWDRNNTALVTSAMSALVSVTIAVMYLQGQG